MAVWKLSDGNEVMTLETEAFVEELKIRVKFGSVKAEILVLDLYGRPLGLRNPLDLHAIPLSKEEQIAETWKRR